MKGSVKSRLLLYGLSALTIVCGLSLLEVWRPAGLDADYGIRVPGGQRISLSRERSRLLYFRRYEQLLTPFLESWQELKWGLPKGPAWMDIVWTGILAVDRPMTIPFGVDATGDWSVRIGEQTWDSSAASLQRSITLPAGDHLVSIHYSAVTTEARFMLSPLSASFYPSSAFRDTVHRMRGLVLAAFAVCLAGLWFVSRRRLRRPLRHAAVIGVMVLGAYLRLQDRSAVPYHNATADEYYHVWAGRTLVETGSPTSWSDHPAYQSATMVHWLGSSYRIVEPWLDQPPLFSLLVGIWGKLGAPFSPSPRFGGPWFLDGPPLGYLRILPILFSCITLLLIHDIGRRLYDWSVGVGAALIYATTPLVVALDRLIKGESLLIILALGIVATVLARRKRAARWQVIVIGSLCAAAPLVKLTGVFIAPMALLLLWPRHETGRAGFIAVVTGSLCGALALLVYAAILGWDLFWQVIFNLASRPSSLLSAARLLYDPHFIAGPFGPGWVWWLALGALLALMGRSKVLAPGIVIYLLVIASSADQRLLYGWYAIPLYAFLVVPAAANLIGPRFPGALILFWVFYGGQSILAAEPIGLAWGRSVILGGALLVLLAEIGSTRSSRRHNGIVWALILIVAAINIVLILNLRVVWTVEDHDHMNLDLIEPANRATGEKVLPCDCQEPARGGRDNRPATPGLPAGPLIVWRRTAPRATFDAATATRTL